MFYGRYVLTLDFETLAIEKGSPKTPAPIGIAYKKDDGESHYRPFSDLSSDARFVKKLVKEASKVIGHNLKFDLRVLEEHFDIIIDDPFSIEDTMILHFLYNPNVKERGLKPASVQYLGRDPSERDELQEWLMSDASPIKCVKNKKHANYYMRHLDIAPVELVAKYACADVDMTYALYEKLHPFVIEKMSDAYWREKWFMLNTIVMEQTGIRVDVDALREVYLKSLDNIDKMKVWFQNRLSSPTLNMNSGKQLLEALLKHDLIDKDKVSYTETGQISTSKDAIEECLKDEQFSAVYSRFKEESQCVSTFLKVWVELIKEKQGKEECILYTNWLTVKPRTGRLSSENPNFQNFPKPYVKRFKHQFSLEDPKRNTMPECPIDGLGDMPNLKDLIIPRYEDHILICIDYSQQELRLLAHFEDDKMLSMYQSDPNVDIHSKTQELLSESLGKTVYRSQVKSIVFGINYGAGINRLSQELSVTKEDAAFLRQKYLALYPGILGIDRALRQKAARKEPLETLGGRLCMCQDPEKRKDGKWYSLEYKMLNTLIQGSGADVLKEAINKYMADKPSSHLLLLCVHDEILISVPENEVEYGYNKLKSAMESVPCDVKLLAEGKPEGALRWGDLK